MISINQQEEALFQEWSNALEVTMDEFVSDGLLFHDGLIFDGANWVRTCSGNNTEIWINSSRRLLIITRDQPSDDGNVWDVRGETPYSPDGYSLKKIPMLKCLIPWAYASLLYDNETQGMCPKDEISKIGFWMTAPIARINCGKVAGNRVKDGGCPRKKVIGYLKESKTFILKQLKIYDANIILCCSGYDTQSNPIIDFIKSNYLQDLAKINNYIWFSVAQKKIIIDSYHFSNRYINSYQEAKYIRDSILEAKSKGFTID